MKANCPNSFENDSLNRILMENQIQNEAPNDKPKAHIEFTEPLLASEKCPEHHWKNLYYYCSCMKKLCPICLKTHSHENMSFSTIKAFYSKTLEEMEKIMELIENYQNELIVNDGNKEMEKLQYIRKTKESLIRVLEHKSEFYNTPIEQLNQIKANNMGEKIRENVMGFLESLVQANQEKLDKLLEEKLK